MLLRSLSGLAFPEFRSRGAAVSLSRPAGPSLTGAQPGRGACALQGEPLPGSSTHSSVSADFGGRCLAGSSEWSAASVQPGGGEGMASAGVPRTPVPSGLREPGPSGAASRPASVGAELGGALRGRGATGSGSRAGKGRPPRALCLGFWQLLRPAIQTRAEGPRALIGSGR